MRDLLLDFFPFLEQLLDFLDLLLDFFPFRDFLLRDLLFFPFLERLLDFFPFLDLLLDFLDLLLDFLPFLDLDLFARLADFARDALLLLALRLAARFFPLREALRLRLRLRDRFA